MRKLVVFLLFALFAASGTQALADERHRRDRVRDGEIQRLDEILPHVRDSFPGTFYDADGPFPDGRGGYRYRIKWLTPDGRVIWLDTDARTGRVVGTDKDGQRSRDQRDGSSRPRDPWGNERGSEDSASRSNRFDGDRSGEDRPTFDPGNRRDRRDTGDDRDRGRDRMERNWPGRQNDNNDQRFNRGNRDSFPGRNNDWPGSSRRHGRDG